jgi:hypothetical protein
MKQRISIFAWFRIAFWTLLPVVLAMFVAFHLRVGVAPAAIDAQYSVRCPYVSLRQKDLDLEPGQFVLLYVNNKKYLVPVAYTEGMEVDQDCIWGNNGSRIVPEDHFYSIEEDGRIYLYPVSWVWGEATLFQISQNT